MLGRTDKAESEARMCWGFFLGLFGVSWPLGAWLEDFDSIWVVVGVPFAGVFLGWLYHLVRRAPPQPTRDLPPIPYAAESPRPPESGDPGS